jgi:hypothetical protein
MYTGSPVYRAAADIIASRLVYVLACCSLTRVGGQDCTDPALPAPDVRVAASSGATGHRAHPDVGTQTWFAGEGVSSLLMMAGG